MDCNSALLITGYQLVIGKYKFFSKHEKKITIYLKIITQFQNKFCEKKNLFIFPKHKEAQ